MNRFIVILAIVVVGCSQTKFDTGNSSSQDGAQGAEGYGPGGSDPVGPETYGPGGTDANGDPIRLPYPPESFTASNCMLGYNNQLSPAANPTQVVFNESDILTAVSPSTDLTASPGITVSLWYSDEHAMTLGVNHVTVINAAGGQTDTDYPMSTLNANPGVVTNPRVGALGLTGDQAGTDTSVCTNPSLRCARPLYPAVFISEITSNPSNTSGDFQMGGSPVAPDAVYGTWKGATRVVNHQNNTVKMVVDSDPAPNNSNVGSGISVPSGTGSEGFSTVVSWDITKLGLQPGHSYRIQFMVHDGDQNKSGGDVGENCINLAVH